MRHFFLVLKKINSQSGFNLLEMLLVVVILGIATAVAAPSLVASRQDSEAKEVFTKIKGALIAAQANANRQSQDCTITISANQVTGNPANCFSEPFTIDSNVISVETNDSGGLPTTITYDFEGDTGNAQTLLITRKQGSTPLREVGRCIVIAPNLGMIRTGIYTGPSTGTFSATTDCKNTENDRYDNS